MESNKFKVIKKHKNKKTSTNENRYRNKRRFFPKINTCCCCFCLSYDLTIKLSTILLIVWFCVVVGYNFWKEAFNFDVIIYTIVILSALLFLYGIFKTNLLYMKQYLWVFLVFILYYVYFCIKNIIKALSLKAQDNEIKTKLGIFYRELTIDQMHELLDDTKFFIILFSIIPLVIYVYYFLACGSYVESIEENINDELLSRELEEDIQ